MVFDGEVEVRVGAGGDVALDLLRWVGKILCEGLIEAPRRDLDLTSDAKSQVRVATAQEASRRSHIERSADEAGWLRAELRRLSRPDWLATRAKKESSHLQHHHSFNVTL